MTVDRNKLVGDVRLVLDDVEQLMRQAAGAAEGQAGELRARAAEALRSAQDRLERLTRDVAGVTREAARTTDDWVHENPWSSIGMAAAVGMLIGILVARR